MASRKFRFGIKAILCLIFVAAIVAGRFQPRQIAARIDISRESPHHAPLLTLTNEGKNPIWFEGYEGSTTLGFVEIQNKSNDAWEPCWVGLCGTGLELRRLGPGDSVRVDVMGIDVANPSADSPPNRVCRVSVRCYERNKYDSRNEQVRSESFRLP